MKRFLRRMVIDRRTVYIAAIWGSISLFASVSIIVFGAIPRGVALTFFAIALIFFCVSWISHVLYQRVDSRKHSYLLEKMELAKGLSEIQEIITRQLSEHSDRQINESKKEAFNMLVSLQELKFTLLEDRGGSHEE